jgi:hypothetical protein
VGQSYPAGKPEPLLAKAEPLLANLRLSMGSTLALYIEKFRVQGSIICSCTWEVLTFNFAAKAARRQSCGVKNSFSLMMRKASRAKARH